jgi:hypothetical protein
MRVIDRKIRDGIRNLKSFKRGSSELCVWKDENGYLIVEYLLHHNRIAVIQYDDFKGHYVLWIRDCGWRTRTTKDRLNAILSIFGTNCSIYQKNHEWYLTYGNGIATEYWIGSAKILLGIDPFINEVQNG